MAKAKPLTNKQLHTAIGQMVVRHVSQLSEHVSSVQIICTNLTPSGNTDIFTFGSGDLCARIKAAELFLDMAHQNL